MAMVGRLVLAFILSAVSVLGHAQRRGPLGIDHTLNYDNDGIISRKIQLTVEYGTLAVVAGGALWEGGESRLGKTYWQAVDADALGIVASTTGKYVFTRARPTQDHDPNKWFQGKGHYSFPSGEVTFVTSSITPFVLEYGHDHPAVYALELLPLYDAVARVKIGGHWQSDVLAGFALGTGAGYLAHQQNSPWILGALPHSVAVGYKKQF